MIHSNHLQQYVRQQWLDQLKASNPNSADGYNDRGFVYSQSGQYNQAASDYAKAIELDSQNARAYFNRGTDYYSQGQYDKAIVAYNKAIALDPQNSDAYSKRGNSYVEQGNIDQAMI